jgi:predicted porin
MRLVTTLAAGIVAAVIPWSVQAENSSTLTGSVRIGLTYLDNETVEDDFSIRNFGTRLKWSGESDLENGLQGIAYIELGLNPDNNSRVSPTNPDSSGADRTRQLWAGVSGGFGAVKVGAQYAAFYDMVSSHTDIAWWGSCWTQFECSRETRVLKYEGNTGPLSYEASFTGAPEDDGNDFADQLEFGVNYALGGLLVGAGGSFQADDVNDDGSQDDGGQLFGVIVKGNAGPVGLGLGLQFADEDFADSDDDVSHVTLTGTYGNAYVVFNRADSGDLNPQFATLGYTLNIGPSALMYFEYQNIDDDTENDSETILRATFKYDFSCCST